MIDKTLPTAQDTGGPEATRNGSGRVSRRGMLKFAVLAPLAGAGLAACGSSGPTSTTATASGAAPAAGGGGGAAATGANINWWYLTGAPNEAIQNTSTKAWATAHPTEKVNVTFFQNDAYKTKIKTAIGAGQAPTLIYGWGGGTLRSYVDAGQVLDLTSWLAANPTVKNAVLPASYGPATSGGKIWAYPNENASPIIFYYSKKAFSAAGVQPPKTWDELLKLVDVFKGKNVAPISLGGQSNWTSMMYLEYLFDRVGGAAAFTDVYDGKAGSWTNPDVLKALGMVQDLVKADGFVKGFQSITADSNADWALLYTGRAAMMLHGSWAYGGMKAVAPDFVKNDLGWFDFPTVSGGKGKPTSTTGNPGQYTSISSKASAAQVATAKSFLAEGIMSDTVIDAYVSSGQVCIAANAPPKIAASADKDFLTYAYDMVKNAPNFQQSWDQALSPATSQTLLTSISQLFSLTITPEQFASAMTPTLGK